MAAGKHEDPDSEKFAACELCVCCALRAHPGLRLDKSNLLQVEVPPHELRVVCADSVLHNADMALREKILQKVPRTFYQKFRDFGPS